MVQAFQHRTQGHQLFLVALGNLARRDLAAPVQRQRGHLEQILVERDLDPSLAFLNVDDQALNVGAHLIGRADTAGGKVLRCHGREAAGHVLEEHAALHRPADQGRVVHLLDRDGLLLLRHLQRAGIAERHHAGRRRRPCLALDLFPARRQQRLDPVAADLEELPARRVHLPIDRAQGRPLDCMAFGSPSARLSIMWQMVKVW